MLYGIAAALPHMKQQKSGHIINVSSVYALKIGPAAAVYCATKFAVRALSGTGSSPGSVTLIVRTR